MTKAKQRELLLKNFPIVFEKAVELFDGDVETAYKFLGSPNKTLPHNRSPLKELWCGGEKGFIRVTQLIGRAEHGVFS